MAPLTRTTRRACESRRKHPTFPRGRGRLGPIVMVALALLLLTGAGAATFAQEHAPEPTTEHAAPAEHGEAGEEAHGGGLVDTVARLLNFAILAGALVYLLRTPIRTYLSNRHTQIRSDLVNAAESKAAAAAQIADIDRRMAALPGELDALRRQGSEEIVAEEARIRTAAAAERDRLLEQARRDIDLQVKVAERALVNRAAELAVGVASERIKQNITTEDQERLVDRYVDRLH